jgi:rhamnose utilization protein RhaD (predicted bifunctional aldolase and dehydrogenase)
MIGDQLMKESVVNYCAAIGADSLLVQGAGGNASWKDGDTLWVKASGTWLSDAAEKDIFVPVILGHLQQAIAVSNFMVTPRMHSESNLRPSIETLLHALMPHPVVVHLHAIEILAHLVRHDVELTLLASLGSLVRWTRVSYQKPGAELARAVCEALASTQDANVVFLQNHGVVIGGSDIAEVDAILKRLVDTLKIPTRTVSNLPSPDFDISIAENKFYTPIQDPLVHQLAMDMALYKRLVSDWALYPDHVVFLGAKANVYESIDILKKSLASKAELPELVLVQGVGVFVLPEFNQGKRLQLRCYYDVLTRQEEYVTLNSLNNEEIADLLSWDAEKYRMLVAM